MDVDPGASTNRTVFTFVGDPTSIVEGALAAAKTAFKLIDMTKHKGSVKNILFRQTGKRVGVHFSVGEHPRMGALDVCPFIPIANVSVEECVEVSKDFGRRLADEVGVPVFLYGYASKDEYRKTMPQVILVPKIWEGHSRAKWLSG